MSKFSYLKVGDRVPVRCVFAPYSFKDVRSINNKTVNVDWYDYDLETGLKVNGKDQFEMLLTESECKIAINLYRINKLRHFAVNFPNIFEGLSFKFDDKEQFTEELFELFLKHCEVKIPEC